MTRALTSFCLCLSLAFLPSPSAAETLTELLGKQPELEFVPKPELTECAEGQRCLDLENYKLYLRMRAQYVWLRDVHVGLVPSLVLELKNAASGYELAEGVQEARATRAEAAYDELFLKYHQEVRRAERAKGLSILGGGFPWLLVVLATGFTAGLFIGVTFHRGQGDAE